MYYIIIYYLLILCDIWVIVIVGLRKINIGSYILMNQWHMLFVSSLSYFLYVKRVKIIITVTIFAGGSIFSETLSYSPIIPS